MIMDPKSIYRADPSNWLKSDAECELVKMVIDDHAFQNKYWVTLTYQEWEGTETAWLEARSHLKSWLDHVCSRQNNHLVCWVGQSQVWEPTHFHLIIAAEKPLKIGKAKAAWLHGSAANQEFRFYDPDFHTKRGLPVDNHAVFYLLRHHHFIPTRQIHCPCKAKACRKRGVCKYND